MSGATGDESISAEEEAAVSRILADAAGPLRVPDDVAVRLDDVLSDLVAERADDPVGTEEPEEMPRTDEPEQRRRWPRLLLAAAAVVVVGYGVASVAGGGSLSGSADQAASQSDSGAAVTRAEGGSPDRLRAGRTSGSAANDSSSAGTGQEYDRRRPSATSGEEGGAATLGRFPPRLRSERLDVGVRRALRYLDADATGGLLLDDVEGAQCDAPDLAPGERFLPVLYDGTPAALVARSTRDAATQVTVWSCDGARLDRTTIEP